MMKIIYKIKHPIHPDLYVESLTDFMYHEGWTVKEELVKSHHYDAWLEFSKEYFSKLQYGD